LIEKSVDQNRLESIGYEETKPVCENDILSGRAKNRRDVFKSIN
jgi:flagellar motor protein MotB